MATLMRAIRRGGILSVRGKFGGKIRSLLMHFNFHLSVARMDTMASVASSMGQTVRTAIIPNVAQSIMEVITAKIGTSIASIVLDRVHAIHETQTRILKIESRKL